MTWMVAPGGVTPDFKWQGWSNGGKNQNPKKSLGLQTNPKTSLNQILSPQKSHAEFPSHKNFQRNYTAMIRRDHTQELSHTGTITTLQIVLNTQKNPYLNQPTQKNTCQNFSTQKTPQIENFTPIKIIQSSLPLEIRSTPPDGCPLHFRPSEQSDGKFIHNTNKKGHHSLSLILSEDHKWLIFDFFCFEANKPMLVAIVTIVKLLKPDVKIAANQVIFTTCSF